MIIAMFGVVRTVRFRRHLDFAVPAPGWLIAEADRIAALLRVKAPTVWVVPGVLSPMLWCLGRPRMLIPRHLLDTLEPDRWGGILAHELAHIRRGDPWVSRLELAAKIVWWWNPLYWWTIRRIDAEAELACDAWVVSLLPDDRLTYAESLVRVCAGPSEPDPFTRIGAPALGIAGPGRFFEKRLTMILRDRVPCRLSAPSVVAASLLLLAAAPSWTRATPAEDKPAPKIAPDAKPEPKPAAVTFSGEEQGSPPTKADAAKMPHYVAYNPSEMKALGEKTEKAWGHTARLNLEQYMTEMGRLAATFIPDEAARKKLLCDSMSEALDVSIAKFAPGSDISKGILAQLLERAPASTMDHPDEILKTLNLTRGNRALSETKKLFWANVYPKLNPPAREDAEKAEGHQGQGQTQQGQQGQVQQGSQSSQGQQGQQGQGKGQQGQGQQGQVQQGSQASQGQQGQSQQGQGRQGNQADREIADAESYQKIESEFRNLPDVKALLNEISDKEKELKRVGKVARTGADPALNWLRQQRNALDVRYKKLWEEKYEQISERISTGKGKDRDRRIRAIESTIRDLLEEVKQLREEDGKG
jgi:hypothetical protein